MHCISEIETDEVRSGFLCVSKLKHKQESLAISLSLKSINQSINQSMRRDAKRVNRNNKGVQR